MYTHSATTQDEPYKTILSEKLSLLNLLADSCKLQFEHMLRSVWNGLW